MRLSNYFYRIPTRLVRSKYLQNYIFAINEVETFLLNAIRLFSNKYVCCSYSFACQKRDQT